MRRIASAAVVKHAADRDQQQMAFHQASRKPNRFQQERQENHGFAISMAGATQHTTKAHWAYSEDCSTSPVKMQPMSHWQTATKQDRDPVA